MSTKAVYTTFSLFSYYYRERVSKRLPDAERFSTVLKGRNGFIMQGSSKHVKIGKKSLFLSARTMRSLYVWIDV